MSRRIAPSRTLRRTLVRFLRSVGLSSSQSAMASTAKQLVDHGLRRPRVWLRAAFCRIFGSQAGFRINERADGCLELGVCTAGSPDAVEDLLQFRLNLG